MDHEKRTDSEQTEGESRIMTDFKKIREELDVAGLNISASHMRVMLKGIRCVDWDDNMFERDYFAKCKISGPIDLSSSLIAAGHFLNWYVTGNCTGNVCDLLLGVVYGMRLPSTDETLISTDVWSDKSVTAELKLPASVSRIIDFSDVNNGHPAIEAAAVQKWYGLLFDILTSEKNDARAVAVKQNLVNYVGFLALNLFRASARDPKTVCNHVKRATTRDFTKIWGNSIAIGGTYAPHSTVVDRLNQWFTRYYPDTAKCMAALVYSRARAPKEHEDSVRRILDEGCLSAMKYIGLGCCEWTQKAAAVLDIPALKLLDYVDIGRWDEVNKTLRRLLDDDAGKREYSWPWAGMFNRGAFVELGPGGDLCYIAVMVAIVANCDPFDRAWNIPQLRKLYDCDKQSALGCAKQIVAAVRDE